jgi:hypothetical protein
MNASNPPASPASPPRPRDLSKLDEVSLSPTNQRFLALAQANSGGSPTWRARKSSEARNLFAMGQESGRYRVDGLDLTHDLRALVTMRVPVPCLPDPAGPLQFAPCARLGISCEEQFLKWPAPGTNFVQLLSPAHAWLPNLGRPIQALCLGTTLPAGIRLREILHMVFGALTLQTVQMDLLDSAGVLNPDAALWWQRNLDKVPITREGFVCEQGGPQ